MSSGGTGDRRESLLHDQPQQKPRTLPWCTSYIMSHPGLVDGGQWAGPLHPMMALQRDCFLALMFHSGSAKPFLVSSLPPFLLPLPGIHHALASGTVVRAPQTGKSVGGCKVRHYTGLALKNLPGAFNGIGGGKAQSFRG